MTYQSQPDTVIIACVEEYFDRYPMLVCETKHLVDMLVPFEGKHSWEPREHAFKALTRLAASELAAYARRSPPRFKRLSRGTGYPKLVRRWMWAKYGEAVNSA